MLDTLLFYFFSGLTLGGAALTITRRSAIFSAVWLTVSLLGVAGLFLLLGAEFLFVSQILVYIGGITLLFLFVIMLVNLDAVGQGSRFRRGWIFALPVGVGLAVELIVFLAKADSARWDERPVLAVQAGNAGAIADALFGRYAVPFELASVLLLVAIVGSVWMGEPRR
jgi:NADH-quinone oxidoreductase subunit J